jgi:hypothetical protein
VWKKKLFAADVANITRLAALTCVATCLLAAPVLSAESPPEKTLAEGIAALATAAGDLPETNGTMDFLHQYSDLNRASRLILSEYWNSADEGQRTRFHEALEQRVAGMLIGLITDLDFDTVGIEPFAGNLMDVPIRMGLRLQTAENKKIRFELLMHPVTGDWRILDVTAEGISYLKMLRAQFRQEAARYGIDEAITRFTRPGGE